MQDYNSAGVGSLGTIFFIFLACVALIPIITFWRIFTKAGKPGWASLIPIYNLIVWLEIIGKPLWWIVLLFLPCLNIIFFIWATNLLSKSFGKGEGFTIGLLFLPVIFYPVLGFGSSRYLGPAGAGPLNMASGYQDPNFNQPPRY